MAEQVSLTSYLSYRMTEEEGYRGQEDMRAIKGTRDTKG